MVERRKFLNERSNRIGGKLCPMESCGGKPTESFRERFRGDGAGLSRRAAAQLLGQD